MFFGASRLFFGALRTPCRRLFSRRDGFTVRREPAEPRTIVSLVLTVPDAEFELHGLARESTPGVGNHREVAPHLQLQAEALERGRLGIEDEVQRHAQQVAGVDFLFDRVVYTTGRVGGQFDDRERSLILFPQDP